MLKRLGRMLDMLDSSWQTTSELPNNHITMQLFAHLGRSLAIRTPQM